MTSSHPVRQPLFVLATVGPAGILAAPSRRPSKLGEVMKSRYDLACRCPKCLRISTGVSKHVSRRDFEHSYMAEELFVSLVHWATREYAWYRYYADQD
jgi:hypothetical protein